MILYHNFFRLDETSILNPIELTDILEESSQHLNRIYVSLVTNTTALKRTTKIIDSVLYRDKYASDVAICTLSEIANILNSMELAVHTKIKVNIIQGKTAAEIKLAAPYSRIFK